MRRRYIDNLRWMLLLVLIPYHAAMAWNVWGEPNYINFTGDRLISGTVVFFSPFFMPLMFLLAGISTRYALQKRTIGQYIAERAKRLLVPLAFGTLALMPIMSYFADRFSSGYDGGFFRHYAVFFTRFTDLTGADGGFSLGQFWFLLYLFVISAAGAGVAALSKKLISVPGKPPAFLLVLALGLPLPLLSECLSVGGKSLAEYMYLFLLGYFVFTDETVSRAEKYCLPLLCAGTAAAALDVYLFLWTDGQHAALNTAAKFVAEWLLVVALPGAAKRYLDFGGKLSEFMSRRSFAYYFWHFVWVVLAQYYLRALTGSAAVLFAGTVLISGIMTFACCELTVRIPLLRVLTGTK